MSNVGNGVVLNIQVGNINFVPTTIVSMDDVGLDDISKVSIPHIEKSKVLNR